MVFRKQKRNECWKLERKASRPTNGQPIEESLPMVQIARCNQSSIVARDQETRMVHSKRPFWNPLSSCCLNVVVRHIMVNDQVNWSNACGCHRKIKVNGPQNMVLSKIAYETGDNVLNENIHDRALVQFLQRKGGINLHIFSVWCMLWAQIVSCCATGSTSRKESLYRSSEFRYVRSWVELGTI